MISIRWLLQITPLYTRLQPRHIHTEIYQHVQPWIREAFAETLQSYSSSALLSSRVLVSLRSIHSPQVCYKQVSGSTGKHKLHNFSRGNNNWETNYSTLTKSNENSSQSSKKQRECGESARDSLAYSCLLKNELLGTAIEDIKNVSDDKMGYLSPSNRGLFKYQPQTRQVRTVILLFRKAFAPLLLIDKELKNNDVMVLSNVCINETLTLTSHI